MQISTNSRADSSNDSKQSAAASPHTHNEVTLAQLALSIGEIREHIMLFLDPLSLIKTMRVNRAFYISAKMKILQTKLFLSPKEVSSVWIINHDEHTVEHQEQRVRPLQYRIDGDIAIIDDDMTGVSQLCPVELNGLLFPSVDSGVQDHRLLFRQVFHPIYGPVLSRFFLGVVPLGIRTEESCYNMLLTQPPVRRVLATWVLICSGPVRPKTGYRPVYHHTFQLRAERTRGWTLIDLHGVPIELADEGEELYHIFVVDSIMFSLEGVRFDDLIMDLSHHVSRLRHASEKVIGLVCHIPPPPDGEHSGEGIHLEATRIGIHGLFPTTAEKDNVESVKKCQGPWGLPDADLEHEARRQWVGESLTKPEPEVEEEVEPSSDA